MPRKVAAKPVVEVVDRVPPIEEPIEEEPELPNGESPSCHHVHGED